MDKIKKSEIQRRAKRLLEAFAFEARKKSLVGGQRKLIRAQYEKGLLLVKEDFVRLPNSCMPIANDKVSVRKNVEGGFGPSLSEPYLENAVDESATKENLRKAMYEVVQMYILQFQLINNLLGLLKKEICLKLTKEN